MSTLLATDDTGEAPPEGPAERANASNPDGRLLRRSLALMLPLAFSIEWLCGRANVLPGAAAIFSDVVAAGLAVVMVFHIVTHKFVAIPAKYKILFVIALVHIVGTFYVNKVSAGPMIAGLRIYFAYLPLFLLPSVFGLRQAHLPWLLRFLLVLVIIQPPVALVQRFVTGAGISSGDHVVGTLQISSVLTLIMIGSIAMCLAFYIKGLLSGRQLALLTIWLMLPTFFNETKGTLVLLPVAVGTALVAARGVVHSSYRLLVMLIASAGLAAMFVVAYNLSLGMDQGRSITRFVENETYRGYLYQGTNVDIAEAGIGEVHRFDSIALAIKTLGKDPALLALGLGPGNVTDSIVPGMDGRYAAKFAPLLPQMTSLTQLLWEMGLLGFALLLTFCLMVLRDAWVLRKVDGAVGAFGIGWCCTVAMFVVALPYKHIIGFVSIATLFWLGSGCIATLRYRYEQGRALDPQCVNGYNDNPRA